MKVIEVRGLTKFYGKNRGVEDLNFEVNEGEIFGFLGPNGAGKTTAIRLMLDFIRADRGKIKIFGMDSKNNAVAIHREIGFISGENFLYPHMKGRELLSWLKSFHKHKNGLSLSRLLEIFKLDTKRRIKDYSSGNRKKLALVQALVHHPKLLILDEPTNGLDPIMKENLYAVLKSLKGSGTTVFLSSHDLTEVQKVCDRAIIIKDGRIVDVEDIHELVRKGAAIFDITFVDKPSPEALAGLNVLAQSGKTVRIQTTGSVQDMLRWLSQYQIADLSVTKPNIEDIFLTYYK
ncbi:ABC transporter ATP-binding protein [candidate division Kazan bacterium]|uniref:ABC transporter ATP-binding protein n=1 Tax=candidate division Kazan bacterium TaxID=2202143 RepID=A0A420ZCP1_UNCK3|nr:MAG: ABC transporter ATP-binding protein [candidate division Kazan bacterium]